MAVFNVGGNRGQIFQQGAHFSFPHPLDKGLKGLFSLPLLHVVIGNPIDHLGDIFRWNSHRRQAVGAGIARPLAAEHDLEMWHGMQARLAAHAVEAEVGHMVLPTGVKAAADFDFQWLDRVVQAVVEDC